MAPMVGSGWPVALVSAKSSEKTVYGPFCGPALSSTTTSSMVTYQSSLARNDGTEAERWLVGNRGQVEVKHAEEAVAVGVVFQIRGAESTTWFRRRPPQCDDRYRPRNHMLVHVAPPSVLASIMYADLALLLFMTASMDTWRYGVPPPRVEKLFVYRSCEAPESGTSAQRRPVGVGDRVKAGGRLAVACRRIRDGVPRMPYLVHRRRTNADQLVPGSIRGHHQPVGGAKRRWIRCRRIVDFVAARARRSRDGGVSIRVVADPTGSKKLCFGRVGVKVCRQNTVQHRPATSATPRQARVAHTTASFS